MAPIVLNDPDYRNNYFHQGVLLNLQYWQNWVRQKINDAAALDREWYGIVKAILFALELEVCWPTACELVEIFAPYMERRGHWDSWNRVLNLAFDVAQRIEDIRAMAKLAALLGRLSRRQSRFQESVVYQRRSIRLSRQIGDFYNEARACTNLGYYYIEHGQWYRAEVLCCHALRIFEQLDSNHGCAHTENHLGILYTKQGYWNEAEQHLRRAAAIWRMMRDNHGLMHGYNNLGLLFHEKRCLDKSMFYLRKALDQAKLIGEDVNIGSIYLNLGNVNRLSGEYDLARSYYQQAEKIFHHFSHRLGQAQVLDNFALLYLEQKQWPEATIYLKKALKAWRELNNVYGEILATTYIIECEFAKGERQKAKVWLNMAETLINRYDPVKRYHYPRLRLSQLRRSLAS